MLLSGQQEHHVIKNLTMNWSFALPIFFIFCFCYSCKSQGNKDSKYSDVKYNADSIRIDIDSLYVNLSKNGRINYVEISGQFVYVKSDEKSGKYLARFIGGEANRAVSYMSYSDDRKDAIIWGDNTINIESKLAPTSIKIYRLLTDISQYVVFIGKGQSASGSGIQITFFILSKLNKKKAMTVPYEFESRFGSVNSLFDFNKDGALDYLKVSHGKKQGEYLLTVHNIAKDQQVGKGYISLKYELNDEFIILEDQLK